MVSQGRDTTCLDFSAQVCYHGSMDEDRGVFGNLLAHKRRWDKHQAEREELSKERKEVIVSAVRDGKAPPKMVATLLGVSPEAIYRVMRKAA